MAGEAELGSRTGDLANPDQRLRPSERWRLAREIVVSYLLVRRALRREPIAVVLARLREAEAIAAVRPAESSLIASRRLGGAVGRLLALLPGDTRCLVRSLVLVRLLARRGIPAKLIIGTRSKPDFLAHAWVEVAGEPVIPSGGGSFGRLAEL